MKRLPCTEIANTRALWEQYIDPGNEEPEAFDSMTEQEKVALIHKLFPRDCACEVHVAAATLGRMGGSVKSERKAASSAANGRKGGRPRRK